jgi:uncharacterized membrane protein YjjB (DUF3815 family)
VAPLPGWTEALALLLSPLALTVLFRARPRDAPVIVFASFVAYGVQRFGGGLAGADIGMLAAAFTAGVVGNLDARWNRRPAAVAVVPALIVLVPGSLGARSVSALVSREASGLEALFIVVVLAGALVAGVLLANFVIPPRRAL